MTELNKELLFLNAAVNNASDLFFIVSPRSGKILTVNSAVENYTGFSSAQLNEKCLWELDVELDFTKWTRLTEQLKTLDELTFRSEINDTKGKSGFFEIKINNLSLENGDYIIGVARKVEEKNECVSKVNQEISRLNASMVFANVGTWDWDIITGDLYWSEMIAPIFGYEKGALETSYDNFINAVYPEDRDKIQQAITDCIESDKPYEIEHRVVWPDGSIHWLLERGGVNRDEEGNALNMLGVVQDITKLKKILVEQKYSRSMLESQASNLAKIATKLERSQADAEAASKSKSDFLANMSHEIRTPLNAVIGLSHLTLQTRLTPKQRNYIEKVHYSAEGLLVIINDILDLSKIEANKMEIENIDFRLEDVLENVNNLIGLRAEEKGITFKFNIKDDIPVALIGDPLRLGQILINLGSNAVKFTESKSDITISISLKELNEEDLLLHFEVKDSGIGMTSEQQEKLFTSFSQADTSITRHYGGSGLGLAISKRLTELMGGEIWVESEAGVGSCFHFTIRLKAQQGEHTSPRDIIDKQEDEYRDAISKLQGASILLVEDNDLNQEMLREMLVTNGMNIEIANNGHDALMILENKRFDGVLMDIQMPVMDGYIATAKIRENGLDIPIIAMTGNAMVSDRNKALDAGMDDHIAKPINITEMFKTMAKWIKPQQIINDNIDLKKLEPSKSPSMLPELPGIDTSLGMRVVGGNSELSYKLLILFRERNKNFGTRFKNALDGLDPAEAIREVHTLRGVAGNIGALRVQAAARALETACELADKIIINDKFDELMSELNLVMFGLEALNEYESDTSEASIETKTVEKEQLEALIKELYQLIANDNTRASDVLIKLIPLIDVDEYAELLSKVKTAINQYDFDDGLQHLELLMEKIGLNINE